MGEDVPFGGGRDDEDVPFGGGRDAEDVPFVTSPLSLTRIFRFVKVLTEILRALGFKNNI